MKFHIEKALTTGGRLGTITQTIQGRNVTIETPMCTLYTKGGSAPYLSQKMLEKVKSIPDIASMSINGFVDHYDSVQDHGKGLSGFTSTKDRLVFSTLHDAGVTVQSGKNDKSGVAVWGKGGKVMLDPSLFMKMQEAFQPDWLLALGDADTDRDSGEKRACKAVDRTLDFLDSIVAAKDKSETLKVSSLFGSIVGGFSEKQRQRSATETSTRPVQGFLLEGFQKNNAEEDIFKNELFCQVLSKTVSYLPDCKPRVMEYAWSPLQVLQAFKSGIDIFSSAYPHILSEKGLGLTEHYNLPPPPPNSTSSPSQHLEAVGTETKTDSDTENTGHVVDLKHKRYFEDFGPVMAGCQCYACANFTRSYIHHLLNTSELLAHVLLTIHNFERYFQFFHCLKDAAKTDRVDDLEKKLLQQQPQQPPSTPE